MIGDYRIPAAQTGDLKGLRPKLDFPHPGDVAERIRQALHEDAGHFHHFRLRSRQAKSLVCPDLPSHPRQGVRERGGAFAIPRGLPNFLHGIGQMRMGKPRDECEESEHHGSGTQDGKACPLPLGFDAEMATHL